MKITSLSNIKLHRYNPDNPAFQNPIVLGRRFLAHFPVLATKEKGKMGGYWAFPSESSAKKAVEAYNKKYAHQLKPKSQAFNFAPVADNAENPILNRRSLFVESGLKNYCLTQY